MSQLTLQTMAAAGTTPTYVAAAGGGNSFLNNGRTFFHVFNGGGASINVTIPRRLCSIGFPHDVVVAVPAAANRMIGPFAMEQFNNDAGLVSVTYSGVTSVTVGAFTL